MSPIERRNFVADTTHFSSRTGWMAGTSLAEGIDLTIDYFVREAEVAS
jgi:nucleoside-diphosphate-sugar epimerase